MAIRNSHAALLLCVLAGIIFVLAKLYTASPPERVILLPQPDGTPSAVIVQSKAGTTAVLERPYSVARITPKQVESEQTDESTVKTRYKDLFDALPARPRSYQLFFESGGTRLTPESGKYLQLVAGVLRDLKDLPAAELTVIGHADEVGTDALNDELSRRRALAVAGMLKAKGIDTERTSIVGRGSRDPLIPTRKSTAEVKNRRVEIRLK